MINWPIWYEPTANIINEKADSSFIISGIVFIPRDSAKVKKTRNIKNVNIVRIFDITSPGLTALKADTIDTSRYRKYDGNIDNRYTGLKSSRLLINALTNNKIEVVNIITAKYEN